MINHFPTAGVVSDAATDGSDRLRYLVSHDTRGFIKARAELPDQGYGKFMREHFREALEFKP